MTKHTSTRRSLLVSVVALVCCFAMLLGTTFAWFTDSVSSEGNTIQSGTLKVDLLHKDDDQWISLKNQPTHKIFDYAHWEPGYTRVEALKVENLGTLALQYKLSLSVSSGAVLGPNGENLADVIHVYYTNADATPANFAEIKDTWTDAGTLSDVMNSPATFIGGQLTPDGKQGDEQLLTIALHMDETAGNEYQNLSVGNIYVNLVATQWTYEEDSFDENYDKDATFPGEFSASASVSVDTNGEVDQATTVGEQDGIHADIPTGVKMANGATELTLDIKPMGGSQANITLENGETKKSYDIHIDGMSEDNTVPVQITLPGFMKKGLNTTSVELYHVENGRTVAMTLVSNPVNHNEFSYDPATGDVVVAMATFSEVVAVENVVNPWGGETVDTSWYNETDTEFTLENAEDFVGFRNLVDAGNTFEGKTVKLGADINLGGHNFDPIGWGYVTASYNRDGVDGKVFKGTFDGNNKTIRNLYQNGWDLESSTGTDYTYTNCGFGLFAAAADATFKNLTITGANIVAECVEMGILVGLSQGDCTYDNIKVYNSKIANYQRPAGGLIGEVSPVDSTKEYPETTTITNVTIGADVVVGSLWGDFDAPVGGVIGARWDDGNTTEVVMENVTVAARLDVYNDVTSSYQWYAYRRAGMLIGNTDTPPANGKDAQTATATFLECSNVTVYYGDWVNYHYCEFTNYNSSWPFVRVEAGENCSAYSNPRYGVPTDAEDNKVVDANHEHQEGDDCMVLLAFNQLYGGGQGVYGQATHAGVTTNDYAYTIQYIVGDKVVAETFVDSNESNYVIINDSNYSAVQSAAETWVTSQGFNDVKFGGWVNAGSTKVTEVSAGNTENIKLYPYFNKTYTARFVDQKGNVLAWCLFHEEKIDELETTRQIAEENLMFDEGFSLDHWEVHITDEAPQDYNVNDFANYTADVTIYPVYKFNGDVNLIPVDDDGDGDTDYYQVGGYGANTGEQELVEIPGAVNGVPVTEINADAFSSYDDLHSVRIPATITTISSQSFTANQGSSWNPKRDTVTLYYEGDPATWKVAMEKYNSKDYSGILKENWDNNMGDGSRVFFLDDNGKVINTMYWELNDEWVWVLHEHAYTYEAAKNCALDEDSHYEYGGGLFGWGASLQEDEFTNYSGTCDCDSCNGATRPDAEYWTTAE